MTDTGAKPFSCVFCSRNFSRKDRLQSHYNHCQRRGDREPPSTIPKGRRPHACVTCISSKIRCDGCFPCSQCKKKKVQCRQRTTPRPASNAERLEPLDDRVSIQALLNRGTDTFTEKFNLPVRDEEIRNLPFHRHQQRSEQGEEDNETNTNVLAASTDKSPNSIDYAGVFDSSVEPEMDISTGPFSFIHPSTTYSDLQLDLYDPAFAFSETLQRHTSYDSTQTLPDQVPYVSAIHTAIYNKLWCLGIDAKTRQELSACLNFLVTADKVPKFMSIYFRNWHLNCPMIHRPSFDPAKVPLNLVISILFIGAMYSKEQSERVAAKRLLDVAELVVFDSEVFSLEMEINRVLQGGFNGPDHSRPDQDWERFQELQAGFLMVIAQYWGAGQPVSKRRAMESRFGDVIKVARKFNLLHARHQPSDRISETAWLRKESRIRTTAMIGLIDCAMRIYTNYPCRLALAELEVDLPCKEAIFASQHPFMQDESIFAPRLTISQAFALLFDKLSPPPLSTAPTSVVDPKLSSAAAATSQSLNNLFDCDLTVFNLFILIHYLYLYIHSYIMTVSLHLPTTALPSIQTQPGRQPGHQGIGDVAGQGGGGSEPVAPHTKPSPSPTNNFFSSSPLRQDIQGALERWRQLWQAWCAGVSEETLRIAGMFRAAHNFWLVSQLLMTSAEAVDVITGMEIGCDDALTKLKTLLQNDTELDQPGAVMVQQQV
ncbi:hypothetical protein HRR80_008375 [Exophiala dermatitidis]|uniref:Zn(2)-C6 fungal-type domain-containing protein n=1 Tax=Exophiala dermatitidis TaxID=5970 RepID=A0AAN6EMS6_EXODE|nr:hypothetical protein HRR76_000503 [Exophiala dermatitidis]KAJ4553822.1 hypothetical protein HRR77_002193 [Exophiala dermatitidis]KAJ4578149.1 hypothetical protein HRR79_001465 [Exophiala dermatitidis]KAJ4585391.1 hypothetical protein HRR82_002468 [Exophiala dermatitidis]KAJ4614750.1 hypothetical protein HRR85_003539 [Exophiala dermatitidis]